MTDFLVAKGIPFALVATRHPKAASVVIDDQAAANMAIAHLTALGHRRIAYFARGETPHLPESRLQYISRALADSRLLLGAEIYQDITSQGWVQQWAKSAHRPTAAIVHNDISAVRVIAELFDSRFRVPEDLSVISYDNIEFARFAKVPLTSVNHSKEALGRGAVELVLGQIDNAEKSSPKVIELPVDLVVRESTARPKERFSKARPKFHSSKT
jgi:DNA-binding LacI/PurR family transcriptional regulator